MAETAKSEVLHLVPKLSELQLLEITDGLKLKLSEKPKADRKKALRNLLKRFIESSELEDSEDEGLAVYVKLLDDMKALISEDEDDMEKNLEMEVQLKLEQLKQSLSPDYEKTREKLSEKLGNKSTDKSTDNDLDSKNSSQFVNVQELNRFRIQRDFRIQNGTIGGENPMDYGN